MLRRSSRRGSEEYSSAKKRTSRRDSPSPPRRGASERSNGRYSNLTIPIGTRKRDDKREEKKELRHHKERSEPKL